jgi:hypothetical protein
VKSVWFPVVVLITIALMLATLQYRLRMLNEPNALGPYATARIGELRSEPPYQRRILAPWLAVQVQKATGIGLDEIEYVGRFVFLSAVLIATFALAAGMMGKALGFGGALLLASLLSLGFFTNQVIDTYPAMLCLLLGLLAIEHRKWSWLLPLVAIATFFRESIALLIVVFLITPLVFEKKQQKWLWAGALLAVYAGARTILSLLFPGDSTVFSLWYNLWHLLSEPIAALPRLAVIFAPLLLAVWGMKHANGLARSMAITGLVYFGFLCFVGRFDETRIFYEIYVLFIPSIMAGVKKALEVEEMAQTEAQLIEIGT